MTIGSQFLHELLVGILGGILHGRSIFACRDSRDKCVEQWRMARGLAPSMEYFKACDIIAEPMLDFRTRSVGEDEDKVNIGDGR